MHGCNNIALNIATSILQMLLQFSRLAHLLNLGWAVAFAIYWLITSSLLSDLYERYCDRQDDRGQDCGDIDEKFVIFPVFGFICMSAWVS